MQPGKCFGLVLAVALTAPVDGHPQAPESRMLQATVREFATIENTVTSFVRLPSGRMVIYSVESDDEAFT